ncbi:hypothetical protein RFI_25790, partial [Reticulomyxa filosa]
EKRDSCVVSFKQTNSVYKKKIELILRAVIVFLQLNGFEVVGNDAVGFTTTGGGNKEDKRTPEMFSAEGMHWLDSRLERFSIPRMVIALIPSCAKFLHEIWLEEGQIGGWQYALHYCFHRKEDHWLTPWQRLSPSAKYLFTQQVVITIKAIVMCGFVIRSSKRKNKSRK